MDSLAENGLGRNAVDRGCCCVKMLLCLLSLDSPIVYTICSFFRWWLHFMEIEFVLLYLEALEEWKLINLRAINV